MSVQSWHLGIKLGKRRLSCQGCPICIPFLSLLVISYSVNHKILLADLQLDDETLKFDLVGEVIGWQW